MRELLDFDLADASALDMDVASGSAGVFEVLGTNYPRAMVVEFLREIALYDSQFNLASRRQRMAAVAREAMLSSPSLAADAVALSESWAHHYIMRNAEIVGAVSAEEAPSSTGIQLTVDGREHLGEALARTRPPIIVFAHQGPYQAIVPLLTRFVGRVAALGDLSALPTLVPFMHFWAPSETELVSMIPVPSVAGLRSVFKYLSHGTPLAILPEFNLGVSGRSGSTPIEFLGCTIAAPTGPARIAVRASGVLLYVQLSNVGANHYRLNFLPPLSIEGATPEDLTRRVFHSIEEDVLARPDLWWSWPFFAPFMLAESAETDQ